MTEKVRLVQKRFDPGTWADLGPMIGAETLWSEQTELVSYLESTSRCELRAERWENCTPPPDGWEGRWFTENAEVRWVALGDERFAAWLVKETVGSEGIEVRSEDRDFFLIGLHDENPVTAPPPAHAAFREARFGARQFIFPVSVGKTGPTTRASILVRLYRAHPVDHWPEGVDAIEEALDAPLIIEHRFIRMRSSNGEGG